MRVKVERVVAAASDRRAAIFALLGGATAIGLAPIFVRLSEIGPTATAFHRLLLSLPALWLWSRLARASDRTPLAVIDRRQAMWLGVAGIFFAADLSVWHWSITLTSVANSTLLANVAPIFVTIGAWLLFQERVTSRFLGGMLLAFGGAALLMADDLDFVRAQRSGDALGLLTAVFYAGYLLTVARLRLRHSTATVMLGSSLAAAAVLLPVSLASGENLLPATAYGWAILAGLALVSHALGQGLIAYALAHLPAPLGSVGLLWQPVAAALLAWLILAEPMSAGQALGALLVLAGIFVARAASRRRAPAITEAP